MPQRHAIIRPVMAFLQTEIASAAWTSCAKWLSTVATRARRPPISSRRFTASSSGTTARPCPICNRSTRRCPDNALFHRYAARNLIEVGRWSEGYALYQSYVDRSRKEHTGYHVHGRIEALYYLGATPFKRRFDESKPHLRAADALLKNTDRERDLAYGALLQPLSRHVGRPNRRPDGSQATLRPRSLSTRAQRQSRPRQALYKNALQREQTLSYS